MKRIAILTVMMFCILCGCAPSTAPTYRQITQNEAKQIMASDKAHIILDVRTPAEFAEGHIVGAINVPNEAIAVGVSPAELPDKDALILVYCRSGRRSKQAAEKLAKTGYTNISEFGGILEWTGETEK